MSIKNRIVTAWRALLGQRSRALPSPQGVKSYRPQDSIHIVRPQDPAWVDWTLDTRSDQVLSSSSWVYTAVTSIATALASVEWYVEARPQRSGAWARDDDNELAELLGMTNMQAGWLDIIEEGAISLLLSGNALFTKIRVDQNGGVSPRGRVAEVWPLIPRGNKVVVSRERFIDSYEHTASDGKKYTIDADDAVHIRLPNPFNPRWGLSPLIPAGKAVDADLSAAGAQKAGTDNMFVPAGIITLEPRDDEEGLSQEEADDVKKSFDDQYVGTDNAGKIVFLGLNAKYQSLALSPKEVDFIDSRKMTREEILAVYKIPPPLAGILERATYSNAQTMQETWWVNSLVPQLQRMKRVFNRQLVRPDFGSQFRLQCDLKTVPALRAILAANVKIAKDLQALGYSANEANARLGLGMEEDPRRDALMVATNMQPLGGSPNDT